MMAADLMIEMMMKVVMLNVCPCCVCVDAGIFAREPLTLSLVLVLYLVRVSG